MNPLTRPWRHLFDFSGRATRSEYFLFHVTGFAAIVTLGMLAALLAVLIDGGKADGATGVLFSLPLFVGYPVFFIAHIAISIRRLHDHGEPGIKFLLTFIPLAGIVFWFMLVFTRGNDFENDYGHDPPGRARGDQRAGRGVFLKRDRRGDGAARNWMGKRRRLTFQRDGRCDPSRKRPPPLPSRCARRSVRHARIASRR